MLDVILSFFAGIEEWIVAASASAVVFPILFILVVLDGFFPPIPSESAVIALAVVAAAPGGPSLTVVILVAAVGAWVGDQIAYLIGKLIGTERIPFIRGPRGQRMVKWADTALENRGASFIMAARFIPIGRVAVNMAAGALGFSRRRFLPITAVASLVWAVFQSIIGIVAASWLEDSTLLAMVAGIVIGLGLGLVLDKVLSTFAARKAATPATTTTAPAAPSAAEVTTSGDEPAELNDPDPY